MSLQKKNLYEFGEFVLDTSERQLWRGEETVQMPLKAVETLCFLVENHGKLMSKDVLMNELWADTFVEDRNLSQNIFTLRKKLGQKKNGQQFIETVPKLGYRFVAEVKQIYEEEIIELTFENATTITAEGNLSDADIRYAIQSASDSEISRSTQTAERLAIESPKKFQRLLSRTALLTLLGLGLIITLGFGFWFWNNGKEAKRIPIKYDVAESKLERITNSGQAWHPAVSADSKYIAYVEHQGDSVDGIRLQNVETGSVTEVISDTNAEFGSPVFGKNDNYLYYTARDGGRHATLYKVPIFGGSKRPITTNVLSDIEISPDGEWLTFVRTEDIAKSREIVICRIDGSDERVIKNRAEPDGFKVWGISPSWSADGTKLLAAAFTRSQTDDEEEKQYLVELDVATGKETKMITPDFNEVSQPRYMPDGKSFVLLAKEDANSPRQVWQISYPDGQSQRITNDINNYSRLNVSPDGKYLLTNQRTDTSNLYLVDSQNGELSEKLTNTKSLQNGSNGLSWTPDGTQIVYSRTVGGTGNLWILDFETKKSQQITFDENSLAIEPSVTPDGKYVVFASDRTGNKQVWKIGIDGSDLKQLTDGPQIFSPNISTDGEWLFYGQSAVLWRRPLNGGEPKEFLARGGEAFVSDDSQRVIVFYFDPAEKESRPWKYGIMPIEGNQEPEVTKIPDHLGIDWSHDGTEIYYGKLTKNKSNIWIYSIANKTSRKLTDLKDEQIDFLETSPNGKKIAIARGLSNSEVIKITGFN